MKNIILELEEIHGFNSPGEFKRFQNFISKQVANGLLEEVIVDPEYNDGFIRGGKWFRDKDTNQVWRLIEPDYPFTGLFEKVTL